MKTVLDDRAAQEAPFHTHLYTQCMLAGTDDENGRWGKDVPFQVFWALLPPKEHNIGSILRVVLLGLFGLLFLSQKVVWVRKEEWI